MHVIAQWLRPWLALAALLGGAWAHASEPARPATIAEPANLLAQAEQLRTADHPRFVRLLAQLQQAPARLTPAEQWRLRYLDAWETMYQGRYEQSATQLRAVIDRSGDAALSIRASALLLSNLGLSRHYKEAFELANRLAGELPKIHDPQARFIVLTNLSQMLNFAGQIDLAVKYAQMMETTMPPGETLCRPLAMQTAALYNGKRLHSGSPVLQRAIDSCVAAGLPVQANSGRLILGSLYLEEHQPRKALALLDRIAPSVRANGYFPHQLSSQVERAQATAQLGDDAAARKLALAAVAMRPADDDSDWLMEAWQLLYQVAKRQGDIAAALDYHERYTRMDKRSLDDTSAIALAYETVQQNVLAQRLTTEKLAQQNRVLQLQQALDAKAAETSRLYTSLLLLALCSVLLWLFRLKRSQLRFRQLSRHDGLTGIFNRQHFIDTADRQLAVLKKQHRQACLLSIDLDYFKQINDSFGHLAGDTVLKHIVLICRQQLRPLDLFGRLGGEEFGVLLLDCTREQGLEIANRIRVAIRTTPAATGPQAVPMSASLGLAATGHTGYDLHKLYADADTALYRAKHAGRDRVVSHAPAAQPAKAERAQPQPIV